MTPHRSSAYIPVLHPSSARAPTRRRLRSPAFPPLSHFQRSTHARRFS